MNDQSFKRFFSLPLPAHVVQITYQEVYRAITNNLIYRRFQFIHKHKPDCIMDSRTLITSDAKLSRSKNKNIINVKG
jgi:hypothetical protein